MKGIEQFGIEGHTLTAGFGCGICGGELKQQASGKPDKYDRIVSLYCEKDKVLYAMRLKLSRHRDVGGSGR